MYSQVLSWEPLYLQSACVYWNSVHLSWKKLLKMSLIHGVRRLIEVRRTEELFSSFSEYEDLHLE
jgi:hypothetical protein